MSRPQYERAIGAQPLDVALTGRNVEELIPVNALAITDTTVRGETVDTKPYRRVVVLIRSTLNQALTVHLKAGTKDTTNALVYSGGSWVATQSELTIPTGTSGWLIINTQTAWLDREALYSLGIGYVCSVAPSSGSLTIKVWGVPN